MEGHAYLYDGTTTYDLGIVVRRTITKKANLEVQTMFGMNSSEAIVDDMNGPSRDISITTVKKVSSSSERQTLFETFQGFIDGNQIMPYSFWIEGVLGSETSPIHVKVDQVTDAGGEGEANKLTTSFRLLEGGY